MKTTSLALLALLPLAAPARALQGAQPPRTSEVIYYDSWEDGRLVGGMVLVDPTNPLHTDLGAGPASVAEGGSTAITLVNHGDPANRVDFVFVGDGYTAAQLGTYANHVNSVYPVFFSEQPYSDYFDYFNIHRVDVVSNESGVDNDPVLGISKDTALDMGYWCGGTERLLCVDVGKANGEAAQAPDRDQVLAIANSSKYGGAGYPSSDLGTLAGNNGAAIEIALHESGHSMGNLADEYTYGGPSVYVGGEPGAANLSLLLPGAMTSAQAKWYLWLTDGNVDAFEGGGYSELGIYRPTSNSLMNNLFQPFEQVNVEQLVVEIYKIVDPIDDATPPGTYLEGDVLFVTPMQPNTHSLDVEWLVDGVVVPGQTGPVLDTFLLGLDAGVYTITARVTDNTPLVRDEALRAQYLQSERSWMLAAADDVQPPLVQSFTSVQAADPAKITIDGFFLDDVTDVLLDGVPLTISYQDFTTLEVLTSGGLAPGLADLEVIGPEGSALLPDAVELWPLLLASTTGPGGTMDFTIRLTDVPSSVGWHFLSFGFGLLPAPLVVPGIDYGLLLDPFLPVGVLSDGLVISELSVSLFVPPDPTLSGLALDVQAWTLLGFFQPTQSFTNAETLVF